MSWNILHKDSQLMKILMSLGIYYFYRFTNRTNMFENEYMGKHNKELHSHILVTKRFMHTPKEED